MRFKCFFIVRANNGLMLAAEVPKANEKLHCNSAENAEGDADEMQA